MPLQGPPPAFRQGGGLQYTDFPRFHELQAADTGPVLDALLIDAILPLTGEVERLRSGIDVVDIGCGQGRAVNLMARAFPASRFTGLDFEEDAIAAARAEAAALAAAKDCVAATHAPDTAAMSAICPKAGSPTRTTC